MKNQKAMFGIQLHHLGKKLNSKQIKNNIMKNYIVKTEGKKLQLEIEGSSKKEITDIFNNFIGLSISGFSVVEKTELPIKEQTFFYDKITFDGVNILDEKELPVL